MFNYVVVLIFYVFPAIFFLRLLKRYNICLEEAVARYWKYPESCHCADKCESLKKKLSTHFKIQAYDIKTYVITNKAAEETLFLYNTKKAAVFIFIFEITKKYKNSANT